MCSCHSADEVFGSQASLWHQDSGQGCGCVVRILFLQDPQSIKRRSQSGGLKRKLHAVTAEFPFGKEQLA